FVFFFFSSRRRHTRFSRDWSSDVCSSDLGLMAAPRCSMSAGTRELISSVVHEDQTFGEITNIATSLRSKLQQPLRFHTRFRKRRSEERRVGKECRTKRGRDQERE